MGGTVVDSDDESSIVSSSDDNKESSDDDCFSAISIDASAPQEDAPDESH